MNSHRVLRIIDGKHASVKVEPVDGNGLSSQAVPWTILQGMTVLETEPEIIVPDVLYEPSQFSLLRFDAASSEPNVCEVEVSSGQQHVSSKTARHVQAANAKSDPAEQRLSESFVNVAGEQHFVIKIEVDEEDRSASVDASRGATSFTDIGLPDKSCDESSKTHCRVSQLARISDSAELRDEKCRELTERAEMGENACRISTVNGLYQCVCCEKTYHCMADLKVHEEHDHDGVPYQCSYCKLKFSLPSSLKVHERIHTGERPYKCSHCGKSFRYSSVLTVHERLHTGERPYVCVGCDKTFTCSTQLRIHTRTHTGERPYRCSRCSCTFTQRGTMKVHERTHTSERPYECSRCEMKFSTKGCLSKHEKKLHKRDKSPPPPSPPQSSNNKTQKGGMWELLQNYATIHVGESLL